MKDVRCPDCGYRLQTNECPICGKRVLIPAGAVQERQHTQPRQDAPEQPEVVFSETVSPRKKGRQIHPLLKSMIVTIAAFVAIVLTVSVVISIANHNREERVHAYEMAYTYHSGVEGLPCVEPQTVFENDVVTVTVNSYGLYNEITQAVSFTVTNHTDRDLTVSTDEMVVNGYMMPFILFCELEEGETESEYLLLHEDMLSLAGIETVAEITAELVAYDSDDYTTLVRDEKINIQTDAYGLEQIVDDSGQLLFEDGKVRMIYRDAEMDGYGNIAITFFLENLSEQVVSVQADGLYINDQWHDAFFWVRLLPDTRCVEQTYLYDLNELGIESIADMKSVRMDMIVQNEETWEAVEQSVAFPIGE